MAIAKGNVPDAIETREAVWWKRPSRVEKGVSDATTVVSQKIETPVT